MSQVIRISNELYERLEKHANGFDSPSNVIERILNHYEGTPDTCPHVQNTSEITPAIDLEIVYHAGSEQAFKKQLLSRKRAFITLHYTNGDTETRTWNASRFSQKSRVDGNLRSGFLRGWKERGIFKAELSVDEHDLA